MSWAALAVSGGLGLAEIRAVVGVVWGGVCVGCDVGEEARQAAE